MENKPKRSRPTSKSVKTNRKKSYPSNKFSKFFSEKWNRFKKTKFARKLGTLVLIGCITGFICFGTFIGYLIKYIDPNLDVELSSVKLNYTSVVYVTDKETGKPIKSEELYKDENRIWVDFEDIPNDLKEAFIAIEDKRFYKHKGVDIKRTLGAILTFFTGGDTYGGSTITQQLIKNITGEDEVTPQRKIQEIFRAFNLEKQYSKDQILEVYLNTIHFGRGLNGVQTAANTYFGKDVKDLTLAECASIAGITNWPTKYDPYTKPENNKKRQEHILFEMFDQGKITKEEYEAAKAETLNFKPLVSKSKKSKQSYFVDQIIEDVIYDLQKEKGYSREYVTKMLYSGGLKIYSTMDTDVQAAMDEVFANEKTFPKVKGKGRPEASMVIIDNNTGAVLGMVGGRGEKTADRILNRATQTKRQPGSAIKPLSAYAPAIEFNKITCASKLVDKPDSKGWPKNYYKGYRGPVTLKESVEDSINTVAVDTVMKKVGPSASFDFITNRLGVSTLYANKKVGGKNFSDVNASALALGAVTEGVSVLEMTSAFATFPNKGIHIEPYTYTRVVDNNGKTIIEKRMNSNTAMSEQTAFIMTDLLQNAVNNGTGSPARISSQPVAGKTGSTTDNKDRWFVGYTPYYTGGVWFGFDAPKKINAIGSNPAAVLWKQVMEKVHENKSRGSFHKPGGVVSVEICYYNKDKAGPNCPKTESVYVKSKQVPSSVCNGIHHGVAASPENNIQDNKPRPPAIIPDEPGKPKPPVTTSEKPDKPDKPNKPKPPVITSEKPDKPDKPDKPKPPIVTSEKK